MQYNHEDYEKVYTHAKDYLKKVTYYHPEDKETRIGLPHPYVSPNHLIYNDEQFYWDTYFTMIGLLEEHKVKLCQGMVENFLFLYKKYKIIPMRNRLYNLGGSQPPFLTSMALEIYKKKKNKTFLKKVMNIARQELEEYWENHWHLDIETSQSRYVDHFVSHLTSEHESGWDVTSRFRDEALHIAPIDLNSLLYKYEKDISYMAEELGETDISKKYNLRANTRKKLINQFMWNESKGFFFDYNLDSKKKMNFYSVAGFYPMWAGLATKKQAQQMVKNLPKLKQKYGIANTQSNNLNQEFRQHDHPNGWPHQHYIVYTALQNYGYKKEAHSLAQKWLDLNVKVYQQTDKMWEKYDVVKGDIGKSGRYDCQEGFAWSCSIYMYFYNQIFNN